MWNGTVGYRFNVTCGIRPGLICHLACFQCILMILLKNFDNLVMVFITLVESLSALLPM